MDPVIIASDQPGQVVPEARHILQSVGSLQIPSSYDTGELQALLKVARGLLTWGNVKITGDLLACAPRLQVIGVVGVGCDHIDLESASQRGILVGNGPGSNAEAVAEYTLLLILALVRDFVRAQADIKARRWQTADVYLGLELRGATLGLVGLGNIGRRVAELAIAFGMKVLAYDPYVRPDALSDPGILLVPLDEAISQADIVSIHAPLTPQTRGLIGAREIGLMREGAYLVNTARYPIVDEDALYQALVTRHLAAAATDVFPREPPDLSHPLYALDNFVATPHVAAITVQALRDMQVEAAQSIAAVLKGGVPRSTVNRAVLAQTRR